MKAAREITLSTHAVDQASLRVLQLYRKHRRRNEGLATWLIRMTEEAIGAGNEVKRDGAAVVYLYQDIRFVVNKRSRQLITLYNQLYPVS